MVLARFLHHRNCACQTWTNVLLTGTVLGTGSVALTDATRFARLLQCKYQDWASYKLKQQVR